MIIRLLGRKLPYTVAMRPDSILTLSCPDRTGIVYRVSGLLFDHGCNILDAQQFGDEESGRFFLRVHFDRDAGLPLETVHAAMATLAEGFGMDWQLHDGRRRARLLVLVSKQGHCLNDLLFRAHSGQLKVDIAAVASNHADFAPLAASYQVPFHHLPVTADTRAVQEQQIIDLVERERIDLVVLARYMQILSPALRALAGRAINIHHSFLPSFRARSRTTRHTRAGQDHRRHRALRHRGSGRRTDHRTGRGPRGSRHAARAGAAGQRYRIAGAGTRRAPPCGAPHPAQRHRTVVFR